MAFDHTARAGVPAGTTTSTSYTSPQSAIYPLVCLDCADGEDALIIPFSSAADRGRWAAAHRDGTGHNRWWAPNPSTEESHRG